MESNMEKNMIEVIARVLHSFPGTPKSMPLNDLRSYVNNMKPKQKKYMKKVGVKKFIISHCHEFALVDDIVFLLLDYLPPRDQSSSNQPSERKKASAPEKKITPPSQVAVDSIKKDIAESNACVVCSDTMEVFAIGPCFHPICFKCSTKMRVLCKDRHCPVCRTSLSQVVFTKKLESENELNTSDFIKEQKYGLMFENQHIQTMFKTLLEHRCRKSNCKRLYSDFDDLKKHMKDKHGEYFCDICVRHCKIFTHERDTYTSEELRKHEGDGDANNMSSNGGHPLCPFCNVRYSDRDELLRHLQMNHLSCHLCPNESHVFYADERQMWNEHHVSSHRVCTDPGCYALSSSVFVDEEELQKHIKTHHPSRKSSSRQQFNRAALPIWSNEASSGRLRWTSISRADMSVSPDGHLHCTGRVIRVTSYFGFIERSDRPRNFLENIFFNQEACALDQDENLNEHFKVGDRVDVYAASRENHSAKWRATDVTKIEDDSDMEVMSTRTRTISASSSAVLSESQEPPQFTDTMSLDDSFPSLPAQSPNSNINAATTSTNSNWSTVVKSKKAAAFSKPTLSPCKIPPKQNKKTEPLKGVGHVHPTHIEPKFSFITRPGTAFEENIYFNLQAYKDGSNKHEVTDLTKEFKGNEKVYYELEEPGKVKRNTKAKYRAVKVWKYTDDKKESKVQPNMEAPRVTPTLNSNPKPKPNSSRDNSSLAVSKAKKKKANKENIDPIHSISAGHSQGDKLRKVTDKKSNKLTLNGLMELDTYDDPMTPVEFTVNSVVQANNPEEVLRSVLIEMFGPDKDDVLFEFENELAVKDISMKEIAFIRFTQNENPKINSVLLSENRSDCCRHLHFYLTSLRGFNPKAIKNLVKREILINNGDLYYVNQTNFYVTVRKDSSGSVNQLYLHTPFMFL